METIYSNKISVVIQGKTVQFLASLSPASSTITLGSSVVLTCTVSGGIAPYIYNWYVDGINVGGYGSTYTYTPSTSGTHTVYVYVVDSQNNSTTSNSSTIIVNQPSVSYAVSVSASQTTNLTTSQQVTFTVNATASDGSSVNGTATLYLTNASGAIWGTFPITLTNGRGSTTIIPGLYLAQGYDTEYYYAIYNGFKSQVYQLTFITSVPPTNITLSASATSVPPGTQVTFNINTNGSNVSLTLYAYNSYSNALNAPSLTGQLSQQNVPIDTSGNGSITLIPTNIAPTTYWIAAYGSVKSNVVTITQQTVVPTYLQLSSSGTPSYMTFTITADSGSNFTAYLYVYNSYANASNAPPNGQWSTGQWGQWQVPVTNGKGSITLVPSAINTNTQYWVAVYQTPSGTILRSNILTVQG
jgi:hypothetical protein